MLEYHAMVADVVGVVELTVGRDDEHAPTRAVATTIATIAVRRLTPAPDRAPAGAGYEPSTVDADGSVREPP
jgi:hypothetical protein